MYESESDSGITHFFEHIAIRNVNKLMDGKLYPELDYHGVEFNASTFSEMVQFYISGSVSNFRFGAEVITRIMDKIVLTADEIDSERKRILAEIREGDDKSSLLAFTNGIVHESTSLARPITGSVSSVRKITKKRLERFRISSLTKENLFFYVTGNFSSEDIEYLSSLISEYSLSVGEIRNNEAPVPQKFGKRTGEIAIKNSDLCAVRFTFDLDMSKIKVPEADLLYDMLLSGYNSRLFVEMSENRGLFYDIGGAVERYKNIGELYFSYDLKGKDIESAVSITVDILNGFKNGKFTDRECMKAGYVLNSDMLLDDARELNFTMAYDNHILDLGYPDLSARSKCYKEVTPCRISEVAREVFRPENLTLTVKGCKKKIDAARLSEIIEKLK